MTRDMTKIALQQIALDTHSLQAFVENCDPHSNAEELRNSLGHLCDLVCRLTSALLETEE